MSNGTRPAVLVSEMFSGDGPHVGLAEEFLAGTCARCGEPVERRSAEPVDRQHCSLCTARTSLAFVR